MSEPSKITNSKSSSRPDVKGGVVHQISNDPFLDWVLILCLALLAATALVIAGISVYLGTGADLAAPSENVQKEPTLPLDEKSLESVLSEFAARSKERDSINAGYVAPKDPSLP